MSNRLESPETSPDVPAFLLRTLDKRWKSCYTNLKQCRNSLSTEAVHDLRVSLRRFLAVLRIVETLTTSRRTRAFRQSAKSNLDDLSHLRDLHVQTEKLEALESEYPRAATILATLADERATQEKRVGRSLKAAEPGRLTRRFARMVDAISDDFADPSVVESAEDTVVAAVDEAFMLVMDRRNALGAADSNTVHDLRLAFKRFRYMVEALRPLLKDATPDQRSAMGAYQDRMGAVHDIETLLARVRSERQTEADEAPDGGLEAHLQAELHRAVTELIEGADIVGEFWAPNARLTTPTKIKSEEEPNLNLYILRHAPAALNGTQGNDIDSDRPLTQKGTKSMRRAAKGMKAIDVSFDLVLTSPYLRAHETADIIADVYKLSEEKLIVSDALTPEGDPRDLIAQVRSHDPAAKSILVIGHEPYLSGLISVITSGDLTTSIAFKKGALARLDVDVLDYARCGSLVWLLTRRQLAALK